VARPDREAADRADVRRVRTRYIESLRVDCGRAAAENEHSLFAAAEDERFYDRADLGADRRCGIGRGAGLAREDDRVRKVGWRRHAPIMRRDSFGSGIWT
jgi:hypothetical protein